MQQEIDALRTRLAEVEKNAARMSIAAKAALFAMDSAEVECQNFHHNKKDQHPIGKDCAPMTRWEVAYSALEDALMVEIKEQT